MTCVTPNYELQPQTQGQNVTPNLFSEPELHGWKHPRVIHGSVNAHFGGEERLEMAVELGTKAAERGQSERRLLQRREGSQSPEPAGAGPVNFPPLPGTWIQLCHQIALESQERTPPRG